MSFTTRNQDNDANGKNCADNRVAWWFKTCHFRTGNSPFIRAILEQRSCSGNFSYYLLGGQGFIKYKSGPVYKSCPLLKKIAHTHKQQNKKPRVIIFYLNHDAC
jgi:hypothetical protein